MDILPKVNKANMVGRIKTVKEYLRSYHGAKRAPLAYVIRKNVVIQTCGIHPWYAT